MIDLSESVLSTLRDSTRPTDGKMVTALESRLADDERVISRLVASGTLTHERDGETTDRGGGDGGLLFAATDRKLVFVLDTPTGRETADVPYTDLKDATVESGLLSTTVSVTVWGRGRFSFSPSKGDTVSETIEYITAASETWQRVVAAVQDARQHATVVGETLRDGHTADAADASEAARNCLETARARSRDALDPLRDPLADRIAAAETDLRRARMDGHAERGRTLAAQAPSVTETADYDRTAATLSTARAQFERALQIATEEGFDAEPTIREDLSTLDDRLATFGRQPLAQAKRALAEAQAVTGPEAKIECWQRALERYRETLVAGWGTDVQFDGETDALRYQIEWLAARVIRLRTERAETLASEADDLAGTDPETAKRRYEAARDHLSAATDLAAQYRAGDADTLRSWLDGLHTDAER